MYLCRGEICTEFEDLTMTFVCHPSFGIERLIKALKIPI